MIRLSVPEILQPGFFVTDGRTEELGILVVGLKMLCTLYSVLKYNSCKIVWKIWCAPDLVVVVVVVVVYSSQTWCASALFKPRRALRSAQ